MYGWMDGAGRGGSLKVYRNGKTQNRDERSEGSVKEVSADVRSQN